MRNSINTLLIIDIGVIIFCLLSGNRIWLINSQIGFVTSSLVMIASIISYRNMVKDRLDLGIVVSVDNPCQSGQHPGFLQKASERYEIPLRLHL